MLLTAAECGYMKEKHFCFLTEKSVVEFWWSGNFLMDIQFTNAVHLILNNSEAQFSFTNFSLKIVYCP